jgi:predicted Zn-dependent peptidase
MFVANQILGGGMSSRLFQEVREERGLAYSVYSYVSSFDDSGAVVVYAGTAPDQVDELLAVVDDQVGKLVHDGPTAKEVEVASGFLEGSLLLGLEDSGGRMARLGRGLMARDDIVAIDEHVARIRAVTADDVRRVATRVFTSPRSISAIGPFDEERFA